MDLRHSSAYEMILNEGRLQVARKWVIRTGEFRLGPPPDDVLKVVNALDDLQRLEELCIKAIRIASWSELLDAP